MVLPAGLWAPRGRRASVDWEGWGGETGLLLLAAAQPWGGRQLFLHLQQLEEGVSAVFLPLPLEWEKHICLLLPEY